MSIAKEELDQLNHEMAVAKYGRYIIADLRYREPDLIGWYPDWEQYYTDAFEHTSLLDPENNASRLKKLPLYHRLYVDTNEERKVELKHALDGLHANLRFDKTSDEHAYQLFCEAMKDQLIYLPEGLIVEADLYIAHLLKTRDPITNKSFFTENTQVL